MYEAHNTRPLVKVVGEVCKYIYHIDRSSDVTQTGGCRFSLIKQPKFTSYQTPHYSVALIKQQHQTPTLYEHVLRYVESEAIGVNVKGRHNDCGQFWVVYLPTWLFYPSNSEQYDKGYITLKNLVRERITKKFWKSSRKIIKMIWKITKLSYLWLIDFCIVRKNFFSVGLQIQWAWSWRRKDYHNTNHWIGRMVLQASHVHTHTLSFSATAQ